MATLYTIKKTKKHLKIYICGCMHLCINRRKLLGIQSWVDSASEKEIQKGFGDKKWVIEFTFKNGKRIVSEYDIVTKWKEILKLLDKKV